MKPAYCYFLFGVVDKGHLKEYCDMIQEVDCEIVSFSSGVVPMPQNHLTLHNGARPQMLAVTEVYVRCLVGEYENVLARLKAREESQSKKVLP